MKTTIYFLVFTVFLLVFSTNTVGQKNNKSDIKASIAGLSSGEISKTVLINSNLIECSDKNYEILYYSLSILRKNGDIIVYNGSGNALNESMKAEFKQLEPGSKFVIEDIGAKSSDEKLIKLPPIVLTIN